MKLILLLFLSLFFGQLAVAQTTDGVKKLPSVIVKDIQGKPFKVSDIQNDGKPVVINFWATWCKPCLLELNTIHDLYDDWQKETGVKIVAVSLDDARTSSKVPSVVNGRAWKYQVLIDENGDLRRAMNVANPPHTFVLNSKGEIVYQHNAYAPGDEDALYEVIKKINADAAAH